MDITIFSMEELIILKTLSQECNWITAPGEKEFFQTLENLGNNSKNSLYNEFIKQFYNKCLLIRYQTIVKNINELIGEKNYE